MRVGLIGAGNMARALARGWAEPVLVSDVGHIAEQRPCLTYHLDEDGLDAASLENAVRRAYDERPAWRADPRGRRREREQLSAAHRSLYRRLLGWSS